MATAVEQKQWGEPGEHSGVWGKVVWLPWASAAPSVEWDSPSCAVRLTRLWLGSTGVCESVGELLGLCTGWKLRAEVVRADIRGASLA